METVNEGDVLKINNDNHEFNFHYFSNYEMFGIKLLILFDQKQTANGLAKERFDNYKNQPLQYTFPNHFTGKLTVIDATNQDQKQLLFVKKDLILSVKWQMQCI